jgi:hypothetical protein
MSFDDDMLIAAVHRSASQQKASMRTGKVVSVNAAAGTIVVEVSGVQLRDIPYDAGLSPIPGKVVWLIDQGPWIAAVAAPASTGQGGGSGGSSGGGTGVTDHGALTGLGDDDHPHYLTAARGDVRYPLKADLAAVAETVPAAIADHESKSDPHPAYLKAAEILAGSNITIDRTTTPGSVIISGGAGGGGGAGDVTVAYTAPQGPPARDHLVWVRVPTPAVTKVVTPKGIHSYGYSSAPWTIPGAVQGSAGAVMVAILSAFRQDVAASALTSPGLTWNSLVAMGQVPGSGLWLDRGFNAWAATLPDGALYDTTITWPGTSSGVLSLYLVTGVLPELDGAVATVAHAAGQATATLAAATVPAGAGAAFRAFVTGDTATSAVAVGGDPWKAAEQTSSYHGKLGVWTGAVALDDANVPAAALTKPTNQASEYRFALKVKP